MVMSDRQVILGEMGPGQNVDNGVASASAKIPSLPQGASIEDVEALIHSHPTESVIEDGLMYSQSALVPTPPNLSLGEVGDYKAIGKYKNIVIVGRLGRASYDDSSGKILNKPLGAAFFRPGSIKPNLTLSKGALKKISE